MGGHGQVPPALRRFGLYERISDRPRLARRARDAHLRRHERDYEGTDRAQALTNNLSPLAGEKDLARRSEEHTSELQSLMRISYAVFCLKKKNRTKSGIEHDSNRKTIDIL